MQNHEQWMKLANIIFSQDLIIAQAIVVHGWGDLHNEMIEYSAKLFKKAKARLIILNGSNEYEIGAPGFSYWKQKFTSKGVPKDAIYAIEPAEHTGSEARGFIEFLDHNKINTAIIVSVPMHITRAYLTNLGEMMRKKLDLSLYAKTLPDINWMEKIEINNLSGAHERTTRIGRLISDYARITEYRARYVNGDVSFPMASVSEALKHLE
jgi:hypothetical protein